jgi:hypothetical protein
MSAYSETSYAETRLFSNLSRTLPYHETDFTACGSRRQIESIYELPIVLIDRHLINLPHHGEPCNLAQDTIAAGRKPAGLTNIRLACRHRRNYRMAAALGAPTHKANKTKPTTSKPLSRRGRRPLGQRLSDVRRLNHKSYRTAHPHTTQWPEMRTIITHFKPYHIFYSVADTQDPHCHGTRWFSGTYSQQDMRLQGSCYKATVRRRTLRLENGSALI